MKTEDEIILMRMVGIRDKLDQFEVGSLKIIQSQYKDLAKELMNEVAKRKGASKFIWTETRQLALLEDINLMLGEISKRLAETTAQVIGEAGAYSYTQMNNIISWDQKVVGFSPIALAAPQIAQLVIDQPLAGKTLQQWMGSAFIDVEDILPEIKKGYIAGEAFSKIVSRVDNAIMGNQPRNHIESIVKTYIQAMNVKAQTDIYEANKEVVKKVEWSALMERGNTKTGRGTCPRCMALDGQVWLVGDRSIPACPLHIRCRCVLSPITVTWKDLGFDVPEMEESYRPWTERIGKQRVLDDYGWSDDNYKDWWLSRNKAFQNAAIGPRRAELVRKGTINFEDIIDNKGNLIPIREL